MTASLYSWFTWVRYYRTKRELRGSLCMLEMRFPFVPLKWLACGSSRTTQFYYTSEVPLYKCVRSDFLERKEIHQTYGKEIPVTTVAKVISFFIYYSNESSFDSDYLWAYWTTKVSAFCFWNSKIHSNRGRPLHRAEITSENWRAK